MKEQVKSDKRSLIDECRLIGRAFGILNKLFPKFWLLETVCLFCECSFPYFGLLMSSFMINELAGESNVRRLIVLAGITVFGGFVISFVTKLLQSKQTVNNSFLFQRHEAFLFAAQSKLQYEHLENPDMVFVRFKNLENMSTFNAGISAVKLAFTKITSNIINVIFSISLTFSMFTISANGEYTGVLGFMNSPASAVVIVLLIVFSTFFSVMITIARNNVNNEAVTELAENNSRHRSQNRRWGADMITFNLNSIVLEEYRKYLLHPSWIAKVEKATIRYNTFSIILNAILTIVIFLFTAAKTYIGVLGIGNFILYQGAIDKFVKALCGISTDIGKLFHNNQYLVEFYDFIDSPNNMYHGTLAVEQRDDIDYEIEFRDVGFQYPRTDTWALRHINIKFKIGDTLAIVGENGSGKTTFIKLLCRLYDPTEGKILLNGIDITRYRYHEYMELFSVVFQDYTLFGFPLGENVAANYKYDEGKARECLIRAGMGDKLKALDNDPNAKEKNALQRAIGREYDSEGIDFSGGELQKIALARALYKDAPFVILDEPTATLDPIAESEIYANFNALVKEKTAVFISHRLSSCKFCDEIAVFDKGAIVQIGNHDKLVGEEDGKYYKLWSAQAQYYL